MAPEQNEGQMLYQTDVYSFGVILFELLTGEVPFPLSDKGETARNTVRLSHMETPPPDLLEKRRQALPDGWTKDKIQHEMHVPEWLLSMIYKCLAKKADQRFSNGIELHDYIVLNSTLAAKRDEDRAEEAALLREENRKLMKMKDQLQQNLLRYQQEAAAREKELQQLRAAVSGSTVVSQPTYTERLGEVADTLQQKGVSRTAFLALLLLTIGLAAFATYSYFSNQGTTSDQVSIAGTDTTSAVDSSNLTRTDRQEKINVPVAANTQTPAEVVTNQPAVNNSSSKKSDTLSQPQEQENTEEKVNNDENKNDEKDEDEDKQEKTGGRYKVRNVAYFHNQPDETTRRNAFINHWNNAILNPLEEQSGFIYIVFTNDEGQVSKGWLRKKDLIRLKD
jgi:serine/threonine-protein kinase